MARAKFTFRLHRTVIVLICLALLVGLMQGASYFSLSHQMARSEQTEELAQTLARQVAYSLAPLMDNDNDNVDSDKINALLTRLTDDNSRILDAAVYQLDGALVAHAGETVPVRDRLALDGKRAGSYFNHQIVEPVGDRADPSGFLRITLDTHVLATESKQVDTTSALTGCGSSPPTCLLEQSRSPPVSPRPLRRSAFPGAAKRRMAALM